MTIKAYVWRSGAMIDESGLTISFECASEATSLSDSFTVSVGTTAQDITAEMRVQTKRVMDPYLAEPLTDSEIEII